MSGLRSAGGLVHLAGRFFGSLRPGPPSAADDAWARRHLVPGEVLLWQQMSNPDRRHAVGVGRCVKGRLGPDADRSVIAAALLHDVGKIESGFRTPARVVATLFWAVVPADRATSWRGRRWPIGPLARYRLHPEIGAELLAAAGSDPRTVDWAADHHRPPTEWRIGEHLGLVLKDCDDD